MEHIWIAVCYLLITLSLALVKQEEVDFIRANERNNLTEKPILSEP
jgi:hypothetical protein